MGLSCAKLARDKVCFKSTRNGPKYDTIPTRSWTELAPELLSSIADNLGLIDLLSFRGVCKSWRTASYTATAEVESSPDHNPWLLFSRIHDSHFLLLSDKKRHCIIIPELHGATCIASNQGWLVLFKQDSIFFLCPLSGSRIDLPKLPFSELSEQVAAFSSPPTSEDCIVCVPHRTKESELEVFFLYRGDHQWIRHGSGNISRHLRTITCGAWYSGRFYFQDNGTELVTFRPRDRKWVSYRILLPHERPRVRNTIELPYRYGRNFLKYRTKKIKGWFGLQCKLYLFSLSISTCGTIVHKDGGDVYIGNEKINPQLQNSPGFRGIWFQPRFFQVPQDQSWSL